MIYNVVLECDRCGMDFSDVDFVELGDGSEAARCEVCVGLSGLDGAREVAGVARVELHVF